MGAVLDDAAAAAGGFDELAAFPHAVGERFLDVNVLAGGDAPDGGEAVPVVGRGDGDRVDGVVGKHVADVAVGFGAFAEGAFETTGAGLEDARINVAERDDFGVVARLEAFDVAHAAAMDADDAEADAVVCAENGSFGHGACSEDG